MGLGDLITAECDVCGEEFDAELEDIDPVTGRTICPYCKRMDKK